MKDKTQWPTVKFGDVVRQVKDKVDAKESGLERYIAGEHMDTDDLRIRRWGEIGDDYLGPAFHMRFRPGQVLYGSRRTYLRKVAVPDFEGICANTTFVLESKDPTALLPEMLPFIMSTEAFHEHSVKQSKGSVNPYVNFSDLAWYEFALPPLEEQRQIAKLLEHMNNYRECLMNAAQALIRLRDSIIKQRSQELADQFGLKSLQAVVAEIQSGKSPSGRSDAASEYEYGVLKVSAVGDWYFYQDENKAISNVDFQPELEIQVGDLLATRANADPTSVGRTCIVSNTRPGLMLSDKTWRLRLKDEDEYSKIGILAWTKSPVFRLYIRKKLGGTEAKNISQNAFLGAPFPSCPPRVFNTFGCEVETLCNSESLIQERLLGVNHLISSYMNQHLNG